MKRWLNLETKVKALFEKHHPQLILIEENFQYKNPKTTAALNQLRGAVLMMAALRGVKVEYIDNQVTKKRMLGGTKYWNGEKYVSVTKDMMQEAVMGALCEHCSPPKPGDHDASDAVAMAYAYYDTPISYQPLARRPKPINTNTNKETQ